MIAWKQLISLVLFHIIISTLLGLSPLVKLVAKLLANLAIRRCKVLYHEWKNIFKVYSLCYPKRSFNSNCFNNHTCIFTILCKFSLVKVLIFIGKNMFSGLLRTDIINPGEIVEAFLSEQGQIGPMWWSHPNGRLLLN